MLIFIVLLFAIFLIWKGSDWLTDSLIPVAHELGTSHIAITTVLASLMISIPEIFSSVYSSLLGHVEVGLGVIIGSVMVNIGICVGLSAVLKPLFVDKDVFVRDGIFLIVVAIIVMVFGSDLKYEATEGLVLLLLFFPYVLNVWFFEKARPHKERKEKVETIKENLDRFGNQRILKLKPSLFTFFLGAVILLGGSYLFSFSLIRINEILHFPDILVGVVFGAIGTGAPNIAAAIQGTLKGYKDAAITETFGSNIFTLLVTLGILILVNPIQIVPRVFYFDLTWMIGIHLLLLLFILKGYGYKEDSLTRYEGIILMLFFLVLLIINTLGLGY